VKLNQAPQTRNSPLPHALNP